MSSTDLPLRVLLDAEVETLVGIFLRFRDGFADSEGGRRPELADVFNALLCQLDDERRRRKREHREVLQMMRRGDRPLATLRESPAPELDN